MTPSTTPRLPEFCLIVLFASLVGCVIGMTAESGFTKFNAAYLDRIGPPVSGGTK